MKLEEKLDHAINLLAIIRSELAELKEEVDELGSIDGMRGEIRFIARSVAKQKTNHNGDWKQAQHLLDCDDDPWR